MHHATTRPTALTRALCTTVLGLGVLGAAPVHATTFDFNTGNAAIEVVIPSAIPSIFAAVAPGDATLVLRFTTLITNAWFDATAPYHPTAVGVYSRLGRQSPSDQASANIALLYASYHTLNSLFPNDQPAWRAMLEDVGLDPEATSSDLDNPIGIGITAAKAMLSVRETDGMNQLGADGGRLYNLQPYADTTGYTPVNTAYALRDPGRWQPDIRVGPYGISTVQQFVTPQYAQVLPYSYDSPLAYATPTPSKSRWVGSANAKGTLNGANAAYKVQVDEVLAASANLTDEQKMIAELFDDKIRSLGFSTVDTAFARGLSLLEFVHYDFVVNVAAFDTGIIIWQEKRKHDAVRPFSAIRHVYGDALVSAWGGPGLGTVHDLPASQWRPYLATADHPEYPSGSSAFCSAHAQASRLYLGSDTLDWTVPAPAGSSRVEPGVTPAQDISLHWATWTEFAEDCGLSRLWGGVHFLDAIEASRPIGDAIGTRAYDFVKAHIDGTTAP